MTQTVNSSVSLSNLDISPKPVTLSSLNNPKPKSLSSTPVKSTTESTVMQNSNHHVNQPKTSTAVELIIENSKPDPVKNKIILF